MKKYHKRYRIVSKKRFTISITLALLLIALTCSTIFSAANEKNTPQSDFMQVTIQAGDTIWDIARHYFPGSDLRKTTYDICRLNDISPENLRPGQTIQIPNPNE